MSRYATPEDYGDRNARLAGEGWSGRDAKRSPRRQPEACPNCHSTIVHGAEIYACEVCGEDCCTACTDTTRKYAVICDDCLAEEPERNTETLREQGGLAARYRELTVKPKSTNT